MFCPIRMADFGKNLQQMAGNWQLKAAVVLFLLGIFVFAAGLGFLVFKDSSADSEVKVLLTSDEKADEGEIVVDVGGAVSKPGVYSLKVNSRVNDAVVAAGGLSAEADKAKVNLAAKIADGQKVYVSAKQEQMTGDLEEAIGQNQMVSGLVSINNASEGELDKLPGIGPVTAGKIIGARPYSSIEELVSKKAVTGSVFEKIKDLVSL